MSGTDIQSDGEHHDLHHAETGDGKAFEQGAALVPDACIGALQADDVRPIAEMRDHAQDFRETCALRLPDDVRAAGGRIDGRVRHRLKLQERAADQPAAGGAGEAIDRQGDAAPARLGTGETVEQRRVVVARPIVIRLCGPVGRGGAESIEILESELGDQLHRGPAAGAADGHVRMIEPNRQWGAAFERFAAMKAPGVLAGHALIP